MAMPVPPSWVTSSAVSSIVSGRSYSDRACRVLRPVQMTVAPASPKAAAMPRPAPRVAPATTTTRPRSASRFGDHVMAPTVTELPADWQLELHAKSGAIRAAERVEQNHVGRALIARRDGGIAIEQVLNAGKQLHVPFARARQLVARTEIHVDSARNVIRVDAVREVDGVARLLGPDQRRIEFAVVDEAPLETQRQRAARVSDEAVDLPMRQARAAAGHVVARHARAIDREAGDIRRRELHQTRREQAVVQRACPNAM